jgi:hypothetical protein
MSDGWFLSGVYYGYPVCCIDEFIYYAESGLYDEREDRKLNGTGYVPCKECNQKSERELLETISYNRLHWEKFPKSGPDEDSFVDHSRWVAEMFLESLERH